MEKGGRGSDRCEEVERGREGERKGRRKGRRERERGGRCLGERCDVDISAGGS